MKSNQIVAGTLVPVIIAGHLVFVERYCEPNCEWLHQPHAPHEIGSTSINSLVLPSAFMTTSS